MKLHRTVSRFAPLLLTAAAILLAPGAAAADKSPREMLPNSTIIYAEMPQPQKLLDAVLDHPSVVELQNHPDYKKALEGQQAQDFLKVLSLVEDKLGMKWRPAMTAITGGGIYFGFDLPSQGVAVLTKSTDPALAKKAVDLVTTNKPLLTRLVIDTFKDENPSLASDEQFQEVVKARPANPTAWVYGDLRPVRALGVLKTALNKKSDNPPAEILAGGILGALPDAPYVTAWLDVEPSRIALSAAIPGDSAALAKKREFFFGTDGKGTAQALLSPKETALSISTFRDFSSMWKNAPDLFDDGINAKFAEAESQLTTLFAGRNFRDDILANLEPEMQIVVTRQRYADGSPVPAVKLPAGAIVVKMKSPPETSRMFKITFQSLVGFLNITGGMNGLTPLEQNVDKFGSGTIYSSEYLPPKDGAKNEAAIQYNASPSIAFIGDKCILSTSKTLATELADLVQKQSTPLQNVNTALKVDGQIVRQMLVDNRGSLVAQNMLQKGHGQDAAEKEIDALLKAMLGLESSSLQLLSKDKTLQLTLELKLK
ncbi:MAG: DUF3352 domain-containing protein [Planctomycetales bacterium]|nr:DUF3352 domain-containing protein [Planctomycetales bacterium]